MLIESATVDATSSGVDNEITQISLTDAANNIVFHMSMRRGPGLIVINGSSATEQRIQMNQSFRAEDGSTIMIHDQGIGYEVWIDWVHVTWILKQDTDQTAAAIAYSLGDEYGTSVLSDEIEVRTYTSMEALFLQKHKHEEEKVTSTAGGASIVQTLVSMRKAASLKCRDEKDNWYLVSPALLDCS